MLLILASTQTVITARTWQATMAHILQLITTRMAALAPLAQAPTTSLQTAQVAQPQEQMALTAQI